VVQRAAQANLLTAAAERVLRERQAGRQVRSARTAAMAHLNAPPLAPVRPPAPLDHPLRCRSRQARWQPRERRPARL